MVSYSNFESYTFYLVKNRSLIIKNKGLIIEKIRAMIINNYLVTCVNTNDIKSWTVADFLSQLTVLLLYNTALRPGVPKHFGPGTPIFSRRLPI